MSMSSYSLASAASQQNLRFGVLVIAGNLSEPLRDLEKLDLV